MLKGSSGTNVPANATDIPMTRIPAMRSSQHDSLANLRHCRLGIASSEINIEFKVL